MAIPPFVSVPIAGVVPFDNSVNGFVSDNVQDAIEEAYGLAELEDNFSYHHVELGRTLLVKETQHMIIAGELFVEGELSLDGYVVFSDVSDENSFSFKESYFDFDIPPKQEMILTTEFVVNKSLYVGGTLSLISESTDEFLPVWNIESDKKVLVKSGREMALHGELRVDGEIEVQGRLIVLQ